MFAHATRLTTHPLTIALTALAVTFASQTASAVTTDFSGGNAITEVSANWWSPGNWNLGVPNAGDGLDFARIPNAGNAFALLDFSDALSTGSPVGVEQIKITDTNNAIGRLDIVGRADQGDTVNVGASGLLVGEFRVNQTATFNVRDTTVNVSGNLRVGTSSQAHAALNLKDNSALVVSGSAYFGTDATVANSADAKLTIDSTSHFQYNGTNIKFRSDENTIRIGPSTSASKGGKVLFLPTVLFELDTRNGDSVVVNIDGANSENTTLAFLRLLPFGSNSTAVLNVSGPLTVAVTNDIGLANVGASGHNATLQLAGSTLNAASLNSRGHDSSSSTVAGFGSLSASGTFRQDSRTVADGGTLSLTWGTLTNVRTTNVMGNGLKAGWFATNGGKIDLPALSVTGANINWGETTAATTLDLVNSVRMTNWMGATNGPLDISLLASDHASVTPGLINPVGIWDFDASAGSLAFTSVGLLFLYDDQAASGFENDLKLFTNSGAGWELVSGYLLNTTDKTMAATVDSFSMFAIATDLQSPSAVPEPSTLALAALGLVGLGGIARRRLRNHA